MWIRYKGVETFRNVPFSRLHIDRGEVPKILYRINVMPSSRHLPIGPEV